MTISPNASNPPRIFQIILASIGGLSGLVLGAIISIYLAQASLGRLGKPVNDEGMVTLLGAAVGAILLGWGLGKLGGLVSRRNRH